MRSSGRWWRSTAVTWSENGPKGWAERGLWSLDVRLSMKQGWCRMMDEDCERVSCSSCVCRRRDDAKAQRRGYCAIRKSLSACSSLWVVAMDGWIRQQRERATLHPRGEMRAGCILWARNIARRINIEPIEAARLFIYICALSLSSPRFSLFYKCTLAQRGRVDGGRALIASLGESAFRCALAPWPRKLTFSRACTFFLCV